MRPIRHALPDGLEMACFSALECEFLFDEIFRQRVYSPIGPRLRPDACVVDAGANIGMFAAFVKREAPAAKVVAIEPIPAIFALLADNAQRHFPDAVLLERGLGARAEHVEFSFYPDFSPASRMRRLASACDPTLGAAPIDAGARTGLAALLARAGLDAASRVVEQDGAASTRGRGILARRLQRMLRNQRLVRAQLEPLSDIIDRLGLERIDLLKIDVEGAECLVLDGWRREHWSRVAEIVVEVDAARGARQVEQQLAERGFTVVVPARDGAGRYVRAHRGG